MLPVSRPTTSRRREALRDMQQAWRHYVRTLLVDGQMKAVGRQCHKERSARTPPLACPKSGEPIVGLCTAPATLSPTTEAHSERGGVHDIARQADAPADAARRAPGWHNLVCLAPTPAPQAPAAQLRATMP